MADPFGLAKLGDALKPFSAATNATELGALASVADVMLKHGKRETGELLLAHVEKRVREEIFLRVEKEVR